MHDPDKFRKYSSLVGPILTHFGGRIRMGAFDVSQSITTPPSGSVVVEFNDPESAQRFFMSSDYAEAKDLFIASTQPDIVFAVETMA